MILQFVRHSYQRTILYGLAAVIWFAALTKGAHDLWAASCVFTGITALALLFCLGRVLDRRPMRFLLLGPVVCFLGALVLSRFHSYDSGTTLLNTWGWVYSFLSFYLYLNVIESEADIEKFYMLASLVTIPIALACLWQDWSYPHFSNVRDVAGTFTNSIALAGFALTFVPFVFERSLRDRRYQALSITLVIILVLARSVWVYACLAIAAFYFSRNTIRNAVRSHPVVTSILALLGILLIGAIIVIKNSMHYGSFGSLGRMEYWRTGWSMWRANPWMGVGLGAYATAFPYFKTSSVENSLFAHSFPIQFVAETGWAGLVALGVFIISAVRLRRKAVLPDRAIYASTLAAILGYSLITIHMEYWLHQMLLLLLIGTLLYGVPSRTQKIRPLGWLMVGLSLICMSPSWLSLLQASRLVVAGMQSEHESHWLDAERSYRNAISLDKKQAGAWEGLSRIERRIHQITHDPNHRQRSLEYLQKAWESRHDIRYKKFLLEN